MANVEPQNLVVGQTYTITMGKGEAARTLGSNSSKHIFVGKTPTGSYQFDDVVTRERITIRNFLINGNSQGMGKYYTFVGGRRRGTRRGRKARNSRTQRR